MYTRALLCCVMLTLSRAMPLYTDDSNLTLPLVLCGSLQDSMLELRQRDVLEHVIGAHWLEQNCVSIDPCAQTSSNSDEFGNKITALAGVWLSGNSSALRLPHSAAAIVAAEAGVRAENYGSLEFARVPEGLKVQACAPDFDLWRREGRASCT